MRRKTFWQNRHYLSLASLSVNTCLLSQWDQSVYEVLLKFLCTFIFTKPGPNVSTTPITAMGCRQCFYLSVVPLKGKLIWKLRCLNGVVDTIRPFGLAHKKIQSCRASGTYENRYLPYPCNVFGNFCGFCMFFVCVITFEPVHLSKWLSYLIFFKI